MARRSLPLALMIALLAAGGLLLGSLLLRIDVGVDASGRTDPVWALIVPVMAIVAAFFGVAGVAMRRPHVTFVGVFFLFLAVWGAFFSHAPLFLIAAAVFVLATRLRGVMGATERGALWAIGALSGIAGLVLLAGRVIADEVSPTTLYLDLGLPAAMLLIGVVSWWPPRWQEHREEPAPLGV